MIAEELIHKIIELYPLKLWGTHGITHWARVLENGRRLSEMTGANPDVIELFAIFHDANRRNENIDKGHGLRGARLAEELRGRYFDLSDADFRLLFDACEQHADGLTKGDVTVMTCWDADRLDLPRVHVTVKPHRLCTDAARNGALMSWALERSRSRHQPALIYDEWGISLED